MYFAYRVVMLAVLMNVVAVRLTYDVFFTGGPWWYLVLAVASFAATIWGWRAYRRDLDRTANRSQIPQGLEINVDGHVHSGPRSLMGRSNDVKVHDEHQVVVSGGMSRQEWRDRALTELTPEGRGCFLVAMMDGLIAFSIFAFMGFFERNPIVGVLVVSVPQALFVVFAWRAGRRIKASHDGRHRREL